MPVGRWDRWQPGAAFFNHPNKEVVIPKTNDNLYELSIRRKATPEAIISTGK